MICLLLGKVWHALKGNFGVFQPYIHIFLYDWGNKSWIYSSTELECCNWKSRNKLQHNLSGKMYTVKTRHAFLHQALTGPQDFRTSILLKQDLVTSTADEVKGAEIIKFLCRVMLSDTYKNIWSVSKTRTSNIFWLDVFCSLFCGCMLQQSHSTLVQIQKLFAQISLLNQTKTFENNADKYWSYPTIYLCSSELTSSTLFPLYNGWMKV